MGTGSLGPAHHDSAFVEVYVRGRVRENIGHGNTGRGVKMSAI